MGGKRSVELADVASRTTRALSASNEDAGEFAALDLLSRRDYVYVARLTGQHFLVWSFSRRLTPADRAGQFGVILPRHLFDYTRSAPAAHLWNIPLQVLSCNLFGCMAFELFTGLPKELTVVA